MIGFCKEWCRLAGLLLAACLARNIQAAVTVGRDADEFRSLLHSVGTLTRIHPDRAGRPLSGRRTDTNAFPRSAGAVWRSRKARLVDELDNLWYPVKRSALGRVDGKTEDEEILAYKPEPSLGFAGLNRLNEIRSLQRRSGADADEVSEPSSNSFAFQVEPSSESQLSTAGLSGFQHPLSSRFENRDMTGGDYSEDWSVLDSVGWSKDSGEPAEDFIGVLVDSLLHSARSRSMNGHLLLPEDDEDALTLDRPSVPETLLWDRNLMSEATGESPIANPSKRDKLPEHWKLLHNAFEYRQPLPVVQEEKKRPTEVLMFPNRQPLIKMDKKGCSPSGKYPDLMASCPTATSVCLHANMLCDGRRDCPAGEDEAATVCFLRYWALAGLSFRLPLAWRG